MSRETCDFAHGDVCDFREDARMSDQTGFRAWIERGLAKPGKRKRQLADALNVDPSAVTRILDGTRRVRLDEVSRIAEYLGETPPPLGQEFELEELDDDRRTVPVKGYVAAGATAHFLPLDEGELDRVDAPKGSTDRTVALEIRGDSLGELFDRWIVFFDDVRSPVTDDLLGKLCVVEIEDGRVLVKKLKRQPNGRFTLLSDSMRQEPIEDVAIRWAAQVRGVFPK